MAARAYCGVRRYGLGCRMSGASDDDAPDDRMASAATPTRCKGKKLERETLMRRVLRPRRPYRGQLIGFLITVVARRGRRRDPAADPARPARHRGPRQEPDAGRGARGRRRRRSPSPSALSLVQRWYSAKIGEGLIYDLRVALFDHVQRLPLSFFTRTQTGALMSRLNNDVIGAQQAVTNTLGTVVSNVITLIVTLSFMLALDWRLTILTLSCSRSSSSRPGASAGSSQSLTREAMQLNASMNNTSPSASTSPARWS